MVPARRSSLHLPADNLSPEAIVTARALGTAEAEVADLRLRLQESLDRELLLRERAMRAEERLEDALRNEHDLRAQIDRLADFHRSVERSAPWRLLQFVRGLVGRRW